MTIQDELFGRRVGILGSAGRFWAELRSNRRALGGVLAIAVLVAGWGLLTLDDAAEAMRGAYSQAMLRQARITAVGDEKDWPARAAASTAMRKALEERLWPAESEGVARANMQDWATRVGREAGLDRLQVRVELMKPKGVAADLRQVTATITALQNEAALTDFLARIEQEPHLLVVERLHVQQRPAASLEMALTTYARLVGPGAGQSGTTTR